MIIDEVLNEKVFFYNEDANLYNENCYDYDINRCFATILKEHNLIDLTSIEKERANIAIGNIIKDNKRLYTEILKKTTREILQEYIRINNITIDDVICIERDGFILNKYINNSTKIFNKYNIRLKNKYNLLLINPGNIREMLLLSEDGVRLKGMSEKSIGIEEFIYKHLKNYPVLSKQELYKRISNMQREFYTTDEISIFLINKMKDNIFRLYCKEGTVDINNISDMNEYKATDFKIDRQYYYQKYLYNFLNIIASNKFDFQNKKFKSYV